MTLAAFPEDDFPEDGFPEEFSDTDSANLDFSILNDFHIPDDLSELDDAPPATVHEDEVGNIYEPNTSGGADVHQPASNIGVSFAPGAADADTNRVADLGSDNFGAAAAPGAGGLADVVLSTNLDAELAAITGEARELALLLTAVVDARPLAAVLALLGVAAECLPTPTGAVVVLAEKDGENPAQAAKMLSQALAQTSVLLVTKATGQLAAERFVAGASQGEVPAGLIVAGASGLVEDLLVGAKAPAEVAGRVSSVGLSRAKAMLWLGAAAGGNQRGRRKGRQGNAGG